MNVEKGKYGQWVISDIVNGHLVKRQYYSYSRKEAIKLFREETKTGIYISPPMLLTVRPI